MGPWPPSAPTWRGQSRRMGSHLSGHRGSSSLASRSSSAPTTWAGASIRRSWMFRRVIASSFRTVPYGQPYGTVRCMGSPPTTDGNESGGEKRGDDDRPTRRLSAADWAQAALQAIGEGGLATVAVEPLATRLG